MTCCSRWVWFAVVVGVLMLPSVSFATVDIDDAVAECELRHYVYYKHMEEDSTIDLGVVAKQIEATNDVKSLSKPERERIFDGTMKMVCVYESGDRLRFAKSPGKLLPNQAVVVWAVFTSRISTPLPDGSTKTVSRKVAMTKKTGSYGAYNGEWKDAPKSSAPAAATATAVDLTYFYPFLPGVVEINVKLYEPDDDPKKVVTVDELLIRYEIKNEYFGAFRTGLAVVSWPAVDYKYEAAMKPGSEQREIATVDDNPPPFDVEFTVGYTIYFGGLRSYPRDGDFWDYFGGYFGLGLIELSTENKNPVTLFKSYYLGLDFEPHESFSFVLAGTARRVKRLKSYQEIGQPLADGQEPGVDDQWRPGIALMVTISPDLFKTLVKGGL